MSTARDYFQEDMHKKPEQLQREADDVRADVEHTVDELMNQFSPGELINQIITRFRSSGDSAFVQNLSTQIQNNPIPALLAGASLTWLMSASKQPPARGTGSAGNGLSHGIASAKDSLSDATGQARSSTHQIKEGARERGHQVAASASDLKERVSSGSHQAVESARSGVRSARDNYQTLLTEQPLVVGALAIAAGAALGALFPRTSAEDRAMGEISDRQTQSLKQKAEGITEKAERKVEDKLQQHGADSGASSDKHSGERLNASNPGTETQGQSATSPSPAFPPAGASGPPGSAGVKASEPDRGAPPREASSAPEHPGANPPDNNRPGTR